jgi:hypothetical protein
VTTVRLGRHSLELALEVTKSLQRHANAQVLDVDSDGRSTVIFLEIPADGVSELRRLRRSSWISFVAENVRRRRAILTGIEQRVTRVRATNQEIRGTVGRWESVAAVGAGGAGSP